MPFLKVQDEDIINYRLSPFKNKLKVLGVKEVSNVECRSGTGQWSTGPSKAQHGPPGTGHAGP